MINKNRGEIFDYIEKKYSSLPEYLWFKFPDYAVFRHADNRKWFAIVMDVPREKLGLTGEGRVDILNVKINDLFPIDYLLGRKGFFKGYHISRGNWISVLLDGSVPLDEICDLINKSYAATASRAK